MINDKKRVVEDDVDWGVAKAALITWEVGSRPEGKANGMRIKSTKQEVFIWETKTQITIAKV